MAVCARGALAPVPSVSAHLLENCNFSNYDAHRQSNLYSGRICRKNNNCRMALDLERGVQKRQSVVDHDQLWRSNCAHLSIHQSFDLPYHSTSFNRSTHLFSVYPFILNSTPLPHYDGKLKIFEFILEFHPCSICLALCL